MMPTILSARVVFFLACLAARSAVRRSAWEA